MSQCGSELSVRKKLILKTVVEAYIANGEPVGSKTVLENESISCSSATVRNEMAELAELGYLEQLHTSSGRIPTHLGYRFYVDSLAMENDVLSQEIAELREMGDVRAVESDKMLEMASKIVSSVTNYTGIAIKPRPASAFINRFEIMYLDEHNFIIVMLPSVGKLRSKSVRCDVEVTKQDAESLADALNACFAGLPAEHISLPAVMKFEGMTGALRGLSGDIIKNVYDVLSEINGGELHCSGIDHLLQYPEYSDVGQLKDIIGLLERKDDILNIVSDSEGEDMRVLIGKESALDVMNNSSFVFKTIKSNGKPIGAIGVLGPTRMDYAKVLATVTAIAEALGGGGANLLTDGKTENK